ncbi:redoxin domain-containing protein [Arenibacter sp. 6A1]|uniref:TlpA family protein disulfide reductase n=1 Tax=Arenibacter sp. 6A1 TaxID=2720391 RepID=UPI00144533B7|nr:TlpA family protein disulfide reductase [Arenibacter sp. 6A1]NKI26626.1 redoxin domain-containing protein [Arenibacter sp. 6A1]
MRFKIYTIAFAALFLVSCKQTEKQPQEDTNQIVTAKVAPVSESLYEDLEGNPISLEEYKGKKILLNFWATWCKPCVEEMPALARAMAILEKENYVFLLASDQSTKKIKAFKANSPLDLPFIKFNGALSKLQIYALPTTFIYNEKGEKASEITGVVSWDSPEMIQKLKSIQ